ncbi:MAG: branched-chain amino acid aminotransferase [Euryarchaeota archaeon]|jgi:branched-chain amino acid aminotransferase|nr:branched-chain amino acid aminotransferase [Euryarchaeota archaeon]
MSEEGLIDWDSMTFSFTPTDVMYRATCNQGDAWQPGEMEPYGDITISPAAGVLNYGQGLFEGMKAQRSVNGGIVLFRPERNGARLADGARRLGMPPVPVEMFLDAIEQVVAANARWVPPTGKGALYIRPVLWGTGAILGVAPAPEYTFMIYVCPVGPYFKGGMHPIALKVSDEYHRAAPGGSGAVKAIGNYAPGMMPSKNAKSDGFAEIIYLDAVEHRYIEEVGAANFFCVKDGVIYTPELTGTILPGITRASIIELAIHKGYKVVEEKVDIQFVLEADECFCAGTAAVISPIGAICQGDVCTTYCNNQVGAITRELYDALTGIQTQVESDEFGWIRAVPVAEISAE